MLEKISVIVPIYNVEKYLTRCIESILKQDYRNLEIILVDDGSKDNSRKIIDKYSKIDKRILPIYKENGGVSSARNMGIEYSTGDYICFVDGDDYLMSDYVSYLYNLIKKNNADIALTKKMFSNFDNKQVINDKYEIYTGERTTIDILTYNIPIGVYCKLFNINFINKNKIRFLEDIYIGEGFNFNVDSFQRSNKVAIGYRKIYYYRRDNETSATTKFSLKKWENGLKALDVMHSRLIIKNKKVINAWKFANWRTNVDIYCLLETSQCKNNYSHFYNKCKSRGRKNFYLAFTNLTASSREKLRAIIMIIYPGLIPKLVIKRREKYSVNISN